MIRLRTFQVIVSVLLGSYTAPTQTPKTQPGIDSVVEAFDKYSIVMLGEVHWNLQQHRFIQELLHDRRLPGKVDDVAVEFGNSLYQPLIDRYVAGGDVPRDSLQLAWRNTTQPLAWDRPIYAAVYDALRDVNRILPASKRIRVIALDPPIDWRNVRTAEDFPRLWGYRDPVWFETLERAALSKGRKVLVIAGGLHILRRDPPDFQPKGFDRLGLGDALAQRYPTATFRIYPATGTGRLAKLFEGRPAGSLVRIAGTPLAGRSSQAMWPSSVTMFRQVNGKTEPYTLSEKDFPPIGTLIDAILYYGSDTTIAPLPVEQYRDCSYLAELRRRNELLLPVFGQDQSDLIASLAKQAGAVCS